MNQNLKIKDSNDEKWVAYLFERLIDEAICHDAHFRVPESFIEDFSSKSIITEKPSLENLSKVDLDIVCQQLKPVLQKFLLKIREGYAREIG
jgi:hypothetical protein